jgi:hypothetical protein
MASLPRPSDRAGIAVSALCVLHCALTPLLATAPVAFGLSWIIGEGSEWLFVASSGAIGCASILPAYWRLHRRKRCIALFLSGIVIILGGRFVPAESLETPLVITGAGLMILAHASNRYFCRRCSGCPS